MHFLIPETRRILKQLRENEFQSLFNSTNEFQKLEEMDSHRIVTLEQFNTAIPADHSMKKSAKVSLVSKTDGS